jgi:uncharacterized repeat protein (TIGR03843 family)
MLSTEDTLQILRRGKLALEGQFVQGSNYAFLASAAWDGRQIKAVYKPARGQMPLYDFDPASLAAREAAAFILSEALGWRFVPPTVIRRRGPFGPGSLQAFIEHDPRVTYFSLDETARTRLQPAALFDLLINNADRKGSHVLQDAGGAFWLIDHGLCFHAEPKLRTVIWDFSGQPIPEALLADLRALQPALAEGGALRTTLAELLANEEINALSARLQMLLAEPVFPQPDKERRPFPWPLV